MVVCSRTITSWFFVTNNQDEGTAGCFTVLGGDISTAAGCYHVFGGANNPRTGGAAYHGSMSTVRNGVLVGQRYVKLAKPCPTDHSGGSRPTAPMVPHSRRRCIQQSANILVDCSVRQSREWGTMSAVVCHLGHSVSTDVVGVSCSLCST